MNLKRFRQIADEQTRHIVMTPQLQERILLSLRKAPGRSHAPFIAAAACLVVMALSAGVLYLGNFRGWFDGTLPEQGDAQLLAAQTPAARGTAVATGSPAHTGVQLPSVTVKLSPEAAASGIVPKQDEETGLWGYADADGKWVKTPQYEMAYPVEELAGRAIEVGGKEILVLFAK